MLISHCSPTISLSSLSPSVFLWFIYHNFRDVVDFRFKILVYCILEYVFNLNTTFSWILIYFLFNFVTFLRLLLKKTCSRRGKRRSCCTGGLKCVSSPFTNPSWKLASAVLKHFDSALANARRNTCVQREYSYVLMKVLVSINRTQRVIIK